MTCMDFVQLLQKLMKWLFQKHCYADGDGSDPFCTFLSVLI